MKTKEQFAAMLNGREYGSEITPAEEREAKKSGLVVVLGYSDDNVEMRGCINDEFGAYDGTTLKLAGGVCLESHDECGCKYCGYEAIAKNGKVIEAIWDGPGAAATWTFKTDIPHATFMVTEDGELFCQGIVFDFSEIK